MQRAYGTMTQERESQRAHTQRHTKPSSKAVCGPCKLLNLAAQRRKKGSCEDALYT